MKGITSIYKVTILHGITYSLAYALKEMLVSVTMHFKVDSAISGALTEKQI